MCLANLMQQHPSLHDAIPSAERLSELGGRLHEPADAAICHTSAAVLRHLFELVIGDEAYSIDRHTRGVVASTLQRLRSLAQTEAAGGKHEWTRAILLIDNAIEELEL